MTPLPMTVISGYLGAGKTTLINRILTADHGLRLMILVNDFGAINIDETLLAARSDDTIALTNGCVCCTMGADLFMALGDALDRNPRPDHLIVEASGVSNPARIANAAFAEPDMRYAGIVTVVDGLLFESLAQDPLIGPQVCDQVARADLVVVTKSAVGVQPPGLSALTKAEILTSDDIDALAPLLFDAPMATRCPANAAPHPAHTSWSCRDAQVADVQTLRAKLANRPAGLFRVKGRVFDQTGAAWHVQVVGHQVDVSSTTSPHAPALVGIGISERVTKEQIETWWAAR